MKISLNWLKKFVSIPFSADALASHLTMVGLEVEEIVKSEPSFRGIRVGRITSVKPHPDSKNLAICKVNLNSEEFNVICGAPNVKKGLMVPFAVEGSVLGNGNLVKEVIIKGIHSRGMICSEKELGVGQDHQGIMILDPEQYSEGDEFTIPKGTDQDVVLDINVTPNRPDCLSHIGIAREVGVITGTPVKKPTPVFHEDPIHTKEWIEIQVDDSIACPRYCARVVRNVRVGTSPYWLRSILEHVGIRSIN